MPWAEDKTQNKTQGTKDQAPKPKQKTDGHCSILLVPWTGVPVPHQVPPCPPFGIPEETVPDVMGDTL